MADNLDSVLHLVMVQQVFDFLCSARENISYDISCPSISDDIQLTDENARQTFQADVLAPLLNPRGSLSLDRSECWTTIFKFMHCLRVLITPRGLALLYNETHEKSLKKMHQSCNLQSFPNRECISIIPSSLYKCIIDGVSFHSSDLGVIYSNFYLQLKPCSWLLSPKNATKPGVFQKLHLFSTE